ncbi:MAG: biotin carboxylase N-terminal domain-containing protein [Candidatus Nanopelagicales bacterium]
MFDTVLVANRGEIAVRVIRTLRDLGVRSVAVYSDADAGSRHVAQADEAVRIGPPPAVDSYLRVDAIMAAARRTGAEAIHPGYGFLSENPALAAACDEAGVTFVGPPVSAIESMGDKIAAKRRVAAAGVPVVPGRHDDDMSDEAVAAAVTEVGFPALLKPSAGGGGKGMRIIRADADVAAEITAARREATKSFGDDRLLVERYIERPRHIEVQVLADRHGTVIHLGERECSLQRRHQKVVEEAPSPFVGPELRERLGAAAIEAARSCGYVGAGTVEFIVSGTDADQFWFLEMNTRLQVEHPVTELVTGWDLVEWQLRIAAGEALPSGAVPLTGWAVEARVYAEDPARDFLPGSGILLTVREPSRVRVDSGVMAGQAITTNYDPMIAKVIVGAPHREAALERLGQALADTVYLGVPTNTAYLRRLIALPEVRAGDLHTGLIADHSEIAAVGGPERHGIVAAALEWLDRRMPSIADAWAIPDGWRLGSPAASGVTLRSGVTHCEVVLTGLPESAAVAIDGSDPVDAAARWEGDTFVVTVDGDTRRYVVTRDGAEVWLAAEGVVDRFTEVERLAAEGGSADAGGVGAVHSPMPGAVIAVAVAVGDVVAEGAPLITVEAMKMEHTLVAPAAARVVEVGAAPGTQVAMDQVLVRLEAVDD